VTASSPVRRTGRLFQRAVQGAAERLYAALPKRYPHVSDEFDGLVWHNFA